MVSPWVLSYSNLILDSSMRTPNGPSGFRGGKVAKKLTALILMLVGFILCIPFAWDIMFSMPTHIFTLIDLLNLVLMAIGGTMFMYGVSSFFARTYGYASTNEIELGRIRYAVENPTNRK